MSHTYVKNHLHLVFSTKNRENSSRWMKQHQRDFAWQVGGGVFGVSVSNTSAVIRYIQNQEAHHAKRSFEDEYLLLKKHGISYDSKYVLGDCAAPLGLESFFIRYPRLPTWA